ncbi:MAG: GNAT family N-acetyltransferase [Thermoguttaceae bacterium]|nr:GNAT family N-acetyltransferase [Thermoguttaceae bacterium]
MFDLTLEEKSTTTINFEALPSNDEPWQIGIVVGPSGSGKSSVARKFYPDAIFENVHWEREKAVVDNFGERPIKEITQALTMVGLGSVPRWIQPFHTLSNGEQFRCELARALLDAPSNLVVFDEFTSVVDRTVAKSASFAVSKLLRKKYPSRKFVALSCHYDVVEWLEPDWVLDMATGKLSRRRLRRPEINLAIAETSRDAWSHFKKYHYLSGALHQGSKCFLAKWDGEAVAICATLQSIGRKGLRKVHRLVVSPEFQGLGVGTALLNGVAALQLANGYRTSITTGHPGLVASLKKNPFWRCSAVNKVGKKATGVHRYTRNRASFNYIGGAQ